MRRRPAGGGVVLIIVQNLPVPFDRRVWLECQSLVANGFQVAVVCPKGPGDPGYQLLEGVHLYKYRPSPATQSKLSFISEYLTSFTATLWLTLKVWRRHGIAAIQACNPPDIFWPIGLLFQPAGVPFVYDQHDLCPELYESRFPDGARLPHRFLLALERATYRTARHVISTNESYRRAAIRRGKKHADEITIVRTGPDPDRLRRGAPVPVHLRGGRFLAVYIGVMGPQDGVDYAIRAAAHVKHGRSRHDITFTLIGSGDSFEELQQLAHDLDVDDIVHFTGRAPDQLVAELMSTAHVGLSPDPKNALNDVSTMNKTMEYMAYELPVVAFDLVETRVSAQDAAVYVRPNDVVAYGDAIVELVDDPDRRSWLGKLGRERVEDVLAWSHQAARYVSVYERLLGEREV
jgi:glycosyltransferase involved in cell wall biosynthesis